MAAPWKAPDVGAVILQLGDARRAIANARLALGAGRPAELVTWHLAAAQQATRLAELAARDAMAAGKGQPDD